MKGHYRKAFRRAVVPLLFLGVLISPLHAFAAEGEPKELLKIRQMPVKEQRILRYPRTVNFNYKEKTLTEVYRTADSTSENGECSTVIDVMDAGKFVTEEDWNHLVTNHEKGTLKNPNLFLMPRFFTEYFPVNGNTMDRWKRVSSFKGLPLAKTYREKLRDFQPKGTEEEQLIQVLRKLQGIPCRYAVTKSMDESIPAYLHVLNGRTNCTGATRVIFDLLNKTDIPHRTAYWPKRPDGEPSHLFNEVYYAGAWRPLDGAVLMENFHRMNTSYPGYTVDDENLMNMAFVMSLHINQTDVPVITSPGCIKGEAVEFAPPEIYIKK